jgi:Conjugal transfer protein TraD
MRHRLEAARARSDTREWVVKCRERTRHLIELGGLVAKAGLVELTGDDRAAIYGALLTVADRLRDEEREQTLVLWARRGRRRFPGRNGREGARRGLSRIGRARHV